MSGERFRLPDHVIARRHVVTAANGRESAQSFILLHDQGDRGPRTLSIGEREWVLIEGMDGTRDLAGLIESARARGTAIGQEHAEAFVVELFREGLIVDAMRDKSAPTKAVTPSPTKTDEGPSASLSKSNQPRPIEQLPGFLLHCDGRGSCCRLYPSVLFSPLDAARARAALPMIRDGGDDESRVFLPERGVRRDALAVTLVDGRCAYLGANGYCGIHEVAGALAKPLGCRLFPAAYVDDTVAVRVTPAIECACVVRSATEPANGGAPLVDHSIEDASGLDPRIFVDVLPERILLTRETSVDRARYVDWSRALEKTEPVNAAAAFLSLSRLIQTDLPPIDSAERAIRSTHCEEPSTLLPSIRALRARAERRADETWRSKKDLARQAFIAIVSAAEIAEEALDTLMEPSIATLRAESLYWRVGFFGHQLVSRSLRIPLAMALHDRAVRVVLGRALLVVASIGGLTDPVFEAPLALVEALLRGHGLAAYVLDLNEEPHECA